MPAITPIDFDDLPSDLQSALRPRYERLGYLGDFFRFMGHQPTALMAFDSFTDACKQALPMHAAEAIALTAATRLGNDYERHQHQRLAVRSGVSRQWVTDVETLDPDSDLPTLDPLVRAVQRFVLAAIHDVSATPDEGSASPDRLDDIVALTDDATAAAVALLTARFVGHALVSRACRLPAAVPSIFQDGFDG